MVGCPAFIPFRCQAMTVSGFTMSTEKRRFVEITLNAEKEFYNQEVQPVFMRNIV